MRDRSPDSAGGALRLRRGHGTGQRRQGTKDVLDSLEAARYLNEVDRIGSPNQGPGVVPASPGAESGAVAPQKIVMYATVACGYTWRAKRLLTAKGFEFEWVDVTFDHRTRVWLAQQTGRRTVPQIRIGERWIGGCDDIYALEAKGELDRIVRGAA